MALDAATYGRVEEAEENILNNLNDVKSTVDTLPEKVEQKLDPVQTDMAQLVENVKKQVDELREIVENSPAGVFPPDLFSLSAQSTEEGIKLTYQASLVLYTDGAQENLDSSTPSDKKVALSRTKAVMFRYSDIETPTDITEGNLAFVDYDLFTKNGLGHNATRQKTNTIVGLTQNKTYYISAFPLSTNNVYNLNAGANGVNRTKCQWTGTKGTLTVNVTQDYDYKPLGEYTATLTPTAGGSAITKTQSGAATIVFSGLEAGEYTLSFSAPQYFTAPQSQSVTVVAGQSQTINSQYSFSASLNELSWLEINEFGNDADKIFSVGDTKDDVIGGETITFEILGFNHDPLSDGSGNANFTFGMKNLMKEKKPMYQSGIGNTGYENSYLCNYLQNDIFNNMSSDLKSVIKSVKKKTGIPNSSSAKTDSFKVWLFSEAEVGLSKNSVGNEGYRYEKFVSNSSRAKKLSNGTGNYYEWWLRSPEKDSNGYCCVSTDGTTSYDYNAQSMIGICFGFCI